MKKSLFLSILFICLFSFSLNVKADGVAGEGELNYATYENAYKAGAQKEVINSKNHPVKVYGKSVCTLSPNECKYNYYSYAESVEDVFKNNITCSDGKTKIEYIHAGDSIKAYKGTNTDNLVGTFYWFEEYAVTCISSDSDDVTSGYTGVTLDGTGSSGGSSSGGNVSGGYPSSGGTVDSGETGVITYYIVLAIIAVGAYGLLLVSKKYNLFKKI